MYSMPDYIIAEEVVDGYCILHHGGCILSPSLGGSTASAMSHKQNSFYYFTSPPVLLNISSIPCITEIYPGSDNMMITTMIERS